MSNYTAYANTHKGLNVFERAGLKLLDALDLSENLRRVNRGLETIPNGFISFILMVLAFYCVIAVGSFAWTFDIQSSWTAMEPLRKLIAASLAGMAFAGLLARLVQLIPFSLTVLPTATEMLGSRFSRFDVPAFQFLTWGFILFDWLTDLPMVNQFMNPLWSNFVPAVTLSNGSIYTYSGFWDIAFSFDLRVLGGAMGFYLCWFGWSLLATFFFELVTVLLAWMLFAFFFKSVVFWILAFLMGRGIDITKILNGRVDQTRGDGGAAGGPQNRGGQRPNGGQPGQGQRPSKAERRAQAAAARAEAEAVNAEVMTEEELEALIAEGLI